LPGTVYLDEESTNVANRVLALAVFDQQGHGLGVEGDALALMGLGALDGGSAAALLAHAVPDCQDSGGQVAFLRW
jgi:hypothetical protein